MACFTIGCDKMFSLGIANILMLIFSLFLIASSTGITPLLLVSSIWGISVFKSSADSGYMSQFAAFGALGRFKMTLVSFVVLSSTVLAREMVSNVLMSGLSSDSCKLWAFFAAVSMPLVNSTARAKVKRSVSISNHLCMASLCSPLTNWSHRASFSLSSNSQFIASRRNSEIND